MAPVRGSQKPGTYNLYSNWDFNALGTIFEKKTGRSIYDAFESDIARPIGMQDVVARGGPSENPNVTLPQFETLARAIASARCQSVAAGATPSQGASPQRAGQAAPCHFAVPPFTAHWGSPAPPEGQHRAAPAAGMVGEFEVSPGRSLKITLENGHLQSEQTGSAKQPLVYVSGATFAVGRADGPTTLTFTVGANGRATAVVLRENGTERTLPRLR